MVIIDLRRTDLELHWKDGIVSKQLTPFREEIIPELSKEPIFGAWFTGRHGEDVRSFHSPEDLEYLVEKGYVALL